MATVSEALTLALKHHQEGDLDTAEALYREVLKVSPEEPGALHYLGVVCQQRGRHDEAERWIRQALALAPDYAAAHTNLANVLQDLGHIDEAAQSYRRALELEPENVTALTNLGNTHQRGGRLDEAISSYRRALRLEPDYPEAHNNLGAALYAVGDFDEAAASLQRALQLKPDYAEAHNNLGNVFREQGLFFESLSCYQQAIEHKPDYPEACFNLARALRNEGRLAESVTCYRLALQLRPGYAEAHNNLGNALREQGELDEAEASYLRALELKPDFAEARGNLANVLRAQGKLDDAARSYEEAARLNPDQPLRRLPLATLGPTVFDDVGSISNWRDGLGVALEQLAGEELQPDPADLLSTAAVPPFGLPYHGLDDLPLKRGYARVFGDRLAAGAEPRPGAGSPKVGFVVSRHHEAVFLHCMGGIVERLRPELCERVIVCSSAGQPKLASRLGGAAIRLLPVSERLDRAAQAIRAERFDVLYYWEVGTDPLNYFLPFFRPAPVQCTSWGMPVTSGIAQMDGYLSSRLVEPDGAAEHYSERLLQSETLMPFLARADPQYQPRSRAELGLPENGRLYLFGQRLEKWHPDFDAVVAGILRREGEGRVIAIEDRHGHLAAALRRRLETSIGAESARVVFVRRQSYVDYLALVAACDVVLDSLHYGGAITSYDAFSMGKAVVTLPGRFARGRYTAGCYRKMGIADAVAADADAYVDIAVGLGADADRRAELERRIRESSEALFEDARAVDEHERMLGELIDQARG